MTENRIMRISSAGAYARGLGGQLLHPDPEPEDIERLCREIQATWQPEEFIERRSYQPPVSNRRIAKMREMRARKQ